MSNQTRDTDQPDEVDVRGVFRVYMLGQRLLALVIAGIFLLVAGVVAQATEEVALVWLGIVPTLVILISEGRGLRHDLAREGRQP